MQESISTSNTPNRRARRSYTMEFKRHIVSLCDQGNKSIAQIALEHQINANLIHKWSRQFKGSPAQPMVPVTRRRHAIQPDSCNCRYICTYQRAPEDVCATLTDCDNTAN